MPYDDEMPEAFRAFMEQLTQSNKRVLSERRLTTAEIDQHIAYAAEIDALREEMEELHERVRLVAINFWSSIARAEGYDDADDVNTQGHSFKIDDYKLITYTENPEDVEAD